jgi:hypothetical protein
MSRLPKSKTAPRPEWQRHRLANWLREWEIAQALRPSRQADTAVPGASLSAPADEADRERLAGLVRPFDPVVAVGQVRLLPTDRVPGIDAPVLVCVLSDWEAGDVLVAKVSPFAEPATSGEWLTGFAEPLVRVLSLWNVVNLPPSMLAWSWIAAEFSKEQQADAWTVFQHVTTGVALPAHLAERVGPPIVNPADPRTQYQREQAAVMVALQLTVAEHIATVDLGAIAALLGPALRQPSAQSVLRFPGHPHVAAVRCAMPLAASVPEEQVSEVILWTPDTTAADLSPAPEARSAPPKLYARLVTPIQLLDTGPYAAWDLVGEGRFERNWTSFLLLERTTGDNLGEGEVTREGGRAELRAGDWSRLRAHVHDSSRLVLVIVCPPPEGA